MSTKNIKIGILHSLIGKNDGVSIVIDQSIKTMVKKMDIPLGNLHFLAGHSPPRMNTVLDDVFWHRNDDNRYILEHYDQTPPEGLEDLIKSAASYAKELIADFIKDNKLDIFIVHNSCHPSNFIFAVAVGMYFEEQRDAGLKTPKYLLWWHDSHFERKRFENANAVIKSYLRYIPGPNVDGIVFINTVQPNIGKTYLEELCLESVDQYLKENTCVIPNTCDISWEWANRVEEGDDLTPPLDQYNRTFYKDIGLLEKIEKKGFKEEELVILLQHTRIVERKRIDLAIDFAFELEKKFRQNEDKRCVVLLVSGHSGDEHDTCRSDLEEHFANRCRGNVHMTQNTLLLFGESHILPNREVIVNKKYYAFSDIPAIVAHSGGMGTYFSEVEGFGNNLLEMMAYGLPVVLNRYPIYESDLAPLDFDVAEVQDCSLDQTAVDKSYAYLTQPEVRTKAVLKNLGILENKLNHDVMASKLTPLIDKLLNQ
jgi:glycosyltransferase involved in cell wall biosynthesis